VFLAYFHVMATRNKTLFQIKRGDSDESPTSGQNHNRLNCQLTATLTKSKTGSFLHYYRNLGSSRVGDDPWVCDPFKKPT
jgi:hypothetical protein